MQIFLVVLLGMNVFLNAERLNLCQKVLKQKLHHFCNRFSPDDGPKSGRKY